MDEKSAIKVLKEIKNILDDGDIEYWLDHGALLGAVRDGKFIRWDNDIDLGILSTEVSKVVEKIPEIEREGFRVFVEDRRIAIRKNSTSIDFYIHKIDGDKAWRMWYVPGIPPESKIKRRIDWYIISLAERIKHRDSYHGKNINERIIFTIIPKFAEGAVRRFLLKLWELLFGKPIRAVVPKFYYEDMDSITLYGMRFNVPSPVEDYLLFRYGKGWRKPDPDWNILNDGAFEKR